MLASFSFNTYPGISFAVSSGVAPPHMRATSSAIFTLVGNLLGYSFGPPILGAISDAATQWEIARAGLDAARCASDSTFAPCMEAAGAGLRWAMSLAALLIFGGSWHYWRASRTIKKDMLS